MPATQEIVDLVTREYRTAEIRNDAIKATFPDARDVTVSTNLMDTAFARIEAQRQYDFYKDGLLFYAIETTTDLIGTLPDVGETITITSIESVFDILVIGIDEAGSLITIKGLRKR